MIEKSDVVCFWWQREEFAEQRGDWQTGASLDIPGADLLHERCIHCSDAKSTAHRTAE